MFVVFLIMWPGTIMWTEDYPANTVRGRICLGERLNWDEDRRKETSDIYIKPRMIAIAVSFLPFVYFLYLRHKIRVFLKGFCLRNGTHACIGGRHRRNLLRFSEMTKLNLVIVFYIHLESVVFLLMYNFQDSIGPNNVFYTIHTLYAIFDFFVVV